MGVAIPQVITSDRASGNQVIDGSLKFDRSKNNFLYRVFSTAGNRRTWTWAGWLKPSPDGNYKSLPDLSKWILATGMLLGRLELFAVLVLFFPSFWRN